jgi:molybdenum cofactor guanylyltransferase
MSAITPTMSSPITSADITLGLLAGGRATRLGGLDKAWLERGGVPQVLRWRQRFAREVSAVLVSANREPQRYIEHGLAAVSDRMADAGPLGGLDALADACITPWLLTLPVDLIGVNDCLLPSLIAGRDEDGACAEDDDGGQPLVAVWRRDALRDACARAFAQGDGAVHRLQAQLRFGRVRFAGLRFGNLNTPEDLQAAAVVVGANGGGVGGHRD